MSTAYRWVDEDQVVLALADRLRGVPNYAVDTEFHREKTYFPQLALIQIRVEDETFLLDAPKLSASAIADLFKNSAVAIVHAAQQDLEVLSLACGAKPELIFDTQIAAGFIGYSTPSLASLVQRELDISLPKGDRLTDWLRRPLTSDQCAYAASDVEHLHDLHRVISAQLEQLQRQSWAHDACAELVKRPTQPIDPALAWLRMKDARTLKPKSRGVAQSVAQWREERAQKLDIPIRQVLPDLALLGISQKAPQNHDELSQCRGVDGRHLKGAIASEILAAVARGREVIAEFPVNDVEDFDRDLRPAATLISAWISEVAGKTSIETALLATRSDIIDYLRGNSHARLRTGWRAEIIGSDLDDLRAGSAGISFDGKGGLRLVRAAPAENFEQ